MVVKNETHLKKEIAINSLIKISNRTYLSKFIIIGIVLFCGLGLAVFGYSPETMKYFYTGLVFILIGLIYLFITYTSIRKVPKRVFEKNKDLYENEIIYIYYFKEQSFEINIKLKDKTKKLKYAYNTIKKAYEFNDRFEFKTQTEELLFIDKDGFESEKMVEFFYKNLEMNKIKLKRVKK